MTDIAHILIGHAPTIITGIVVVLSYIGLCGVATMGNLKALVLQKLT